MAKGYKATKWESAIANNNNNRLSAIAATHFPSLKEEGKFKVFTSKPLEEMIRHNNNKYKSSDIPRF